MPSKLSIKTWLRSFMLSAIFLPMIAWGWDATGHKIVAAIAYQQLTPDAKATVDKLTDLLDKGYPPYARFLYISTLADQWRKTGENNGKVPHFINIPWSDDGTPTLPAAAFNVLSVLQQNKMLLTDPTASLQQKAVALAYLVHLIGDVHQPLHCSNRFNQQFPQGDRGGTLFPINSRYANSLHDYWDKAAKLLADNKQHYPLSNKSITRLANTLATEYPVSYFGDKITDDNMNGWVQQCFAVAQHGVYSLMPNTAPSATYKQQLKKTAGQQITLAGDRLAVFLNMNIALDLSAKHFIVPTKIGE